MTIKQGIELVGGEEVTAEVQGITKTCQQLADSLNNVAAPDVGSSSSIEKLVVNIGQAGKALDEHVGHVNATTEAYHILHPLLGAVGLQFGELRAFAALANTTLVGLAGVALASVVIELSKIQDEAQQTKNAFSDLFGSVEAGKKAFDDTEASAIKLGASTAQLADPLQTLTRVYQEVAAASTKGKFVSPIEGTNFVVGLGDATRAEQDFIKANETLFALLRAGGSDAAKAAQQANQFWQSFATGGKLTADALKNLPVGTITDLGQALGKGRENFAAFQNDVKTGFSPTMQQVVRDLAAFQPQAEKAFDAKAVVTFTDEMQKLKIEVEKDFRDIAGIDFSAFINRELEKARRDFKQFADDVKAFKATLSDFFTASQGAATPAAGGELDVAASQSAFNLDNQQNQLTTFSQRVVQAFKDIQSASTTAAQSVQGSWSTVGTQLRSSVDDPIRTAGSDATTMADRIVAALKKIGDQATSTKDKVKEITTTFAGGTNVPFGAGAFTTPPGGTAADVPGAAAAAAQQSIKGLGLPAASDVTALKTAFAELVATLGTVNAEIGTLGTAIRTTDDAASDLHQDLQDASTISFSNLVAELNQAAIAAEQTAQAVQQINSSGSAPASFADRFGGFATGGLFRGLPGVDRNLARLSDFEYIMQPRAVQTYGVDFMDAINRMIFPFDFFSRYVRGFASGGLFRESTASSSSTPTGTPVHIHFPGGGTFQTVSSSENVARSLRNHAVRSRLVSTGRKPGWY